MQGKQQDMKDAAARREIGVTGGHGSVTLQVAISEPVIACEPVRL